jgi:HD superfamily phosphodiesterase
MGQTQSQPQVQKETYSNMFKLISISFEEAIEEEIMNNCIYCKKHIECTEMALNGNINDSNDTYMLVHIVNNRIFACNAYELIYDLQTQMKIQRYTEHKCTSKCKHNKLIGY